MLHQWEEPFVIRDQRFLERFRMKPEDVDKAAAATIAWAHEHYAHK
jgi:hypothetical protein